MRATKAVWRFVRHNGIALVALFAALGGTSYAAASIAKNSVGTQQIKKNGVRSADIANNAVTTPKLKNGAVNAAKIGADAVTGAQINEGTLGPVPKASAIDKITTHAAQGSGGPRSITAISAACPPGLSALSGGVQLESSDDQNIVDEYPSGGTGWSAHVFNGSDSASHGFTLTVICAPAGSVAAG
jgi:hypothetical protein